MDRPERRRKSQSLRPMRRMPFCWPVTKNHQPGHAQDDDRRIAVPKFDSTPSTPILPKIEVRLANSADQAGKEQPSAVRLSPGVRLLPGDHQQRAGPDPQHAHDLRRGDGSPSRRKARRMVSTVLDLSMARPC